MEEVGRFVCWQWGHVNKLLKLSGKVTTLSKGKLSIPNRGTNVNMCILLDR